MLSHVLTFLLAVTTIASGQMVGCDNDTYQCYVCLYENSCYGNGQLFTVNVCANISLDCVGSPGINDSVCVTLISNKPPADIVANTVGTPTPVVVRPRSPCTDTSCSVAVSNPNDNRACTVFASNVVSALPNKQYADVRYTLPLAIQTRQRHFYCSAFGQNGVSGYLDSVQKNTSYWTVFFQYPLLSYMDNARKWALFRVLLETAGLSANDLGNLCVGNYTQYGVSTYNEGMLLHLYFKDSRVTDNLNNAFQRNMSQLTTFLGRKAINVTTYWNTYQVQPADVQSYFLMRPTGLGLATKDDPTLHAIVLGSWSGYYPLELVLPSVQDKFAVNPNPVDYGLEVGDYFFAVFGSIFLFLLMVVIILGFIIHPLFLDD